MRPRLAFTPLTGTSRATTARTSSQQSSSSGVTTVLQRTPFHVFRSAQTSAARKAARHERVCGLGLGVGNCQTEHAELEYAELTYDEYLAHTPRRGARRLERQVQRSRGSLSLREGNRSASDRTHLRCLGARHGRRNERRTERMPRLLGSW